MNKIKKRFSNWKWWACSCISVPLIISLLLIVVPLSVLGCSIVAIAELYLWAVSFIVKRLHVVAHGWSRQISYDGIIIKFTIKEKNND